MQKEVLKVKSVLEIDEDITNYDVKDGKIIIKSEKRDYIMDYSPEKEDSVYEEMKNFVEDYSDLEDINEEIKLLGCGFAFATGYTILMLTFGILMKNFLPMIFALPSVVVQTNTIRSLISTRKQRIERKSKIPHYEYLLKCKDQEKLEREFASLDMQIADETEEVVNVEDLFAELHEQQEVKVVTGDKRRKFSL